MTGPDGTSTYTYDTTNQLTDADHSFQTDESYSYDENGNRASTGYQTGTNNRLLSDGTYSYTYDAEGNRTRKTTIATGDYVEYKWDHRNRLVGVEFRTSGGVLTKKVEYDYDVYNRLIAKRVDDTGDGTFDRAQQFVYDGTQIVLVYDGTGSLENRLLYGPAVDQFFADENALGEVLWGVADHLGTVRDVAEYDAATDTTSVVNHIEYDSFGNITGQTNAAEQPLLAFTGRYWDDDVQLQWNLNRWYEPATALWANEDPSGFTGGDTNLRRYVGNAPTIWNDPSGLSPWQMPDADGNIVFPLPPRTGMPAPGVAAAEGGYLQPSDPILSGRNEWTTPRYRNGRIVGGMGGDVDTSWVQQPSGSFCRWLYTGDAFAPDDMYEGALDAAGAALPRPGLNINSQLVLNWPGRPVGIAIIPPLARQFVWDWGTSSVDYYDYYGRWPGVSVSNGGIGSASLNIGGFLVYDLPSDNPYAYTGAFDEFGGGFNRGTRGGYFDYAVPPGGGPWSVGGGCSIGTPGWNASWCRTNYNYEGRLTIPWVSDEWTQTPSAP